MADYHAATGTGISYGGYGKKDEEEIQYCDCCGEKSSEIKHISYYNQDICQVCIDQYEIYQEKDIV